MKVSEEAHVSNIQTINITPKQSSKIQQAINTCWENGGGCVVLKPGIYVSGTLFLKSNVTLKLEEGAVLLGSTEIDDYLENDACFIDGIGEKRGRALILAYREENIAVIGKGIIDGRGREFEAGHPHYTIRPFLVRFVQCKNVIVENLSLRMSAAWCLHIQDCSRVTVKGISIVNRCNENNDGIDIDGSDHVVVEQCMIDSGDDALCLKSTSEKCCQHIRIRDCLVTTNCSAFKIGTESVGDYEDIEVSDCMFYDVRCCAIKVVPVDGGNVNNLRIHDIKMKNCTGPIFFSTGTRLRRYFSGYRDKPGKIQNVVLERIDAYVIDAKGRVLDGKLWGNGKACVVFSGLRDIPMENILVKDCNFDMPGGITKIESDEVPELGKQYPEFHLFGTLPFWGVYQRNVQKIKFDNVKLTRRAEDVRPMM